MTRRGRTCCGSSWGQNLVEFAILTPIIFLMLIAVIDFGMAMNRSIVLQHAAREGARMAAVSDVITGPGSICQRTVDQAQGAMDSVHLHYDDLDTPPNGQFNAGDNVTVTVHAHWNLPILDSDLFGMFGRHISPINLTATGSARLERTVSTAPSSGDKDCP